MFDKILKLFQTENSSKKTIHQAVINPDPEDNWEEILKNSDINSKDQFGNTALHYAVENGNFEIVELLLSNKANPNVQDSKGVTPYTIAKSYSGLEKIVELLLKYGANSKILDIHGKNYLM